MAVCKIKMSSAPSTKKLLYCCSLGWSENNFFFEIEKSVVLKTCQTGKIYEKNWFWRVATFGGLATPQNVLRGKIS